MHTNRHHIVAKIAGIAASSRKILEDSNIGINSRKNLVTLKLYFHQYLHRKSYYTGVNGIMNASQAAVANVRNKLGKKKFSDAKVKKVKRATANGALAGIKAFLWASNKAAK